MGRPFYPHEANDPDLDWLVTNFLYERPDFVPAEAPMLPLVLLPYRDIKDSLDEWLEDEMPIPSEEEGDTLEKEIGKK